MAGFRKAAAQQAAIKMGFYGPPGSGKTLTSLLLAEGLAGLRGKRVAMIDTEHGSDFYCQAVPSRAVHPEAFDFDCLYSRSITEALDSLRTLDLDTYGVVIIDSITHLWAAAIEAYGGRQTSAGTIPFRAWAKIKKPYKDLMAWLLSTPLHVIICGRQGVEYATDEETEELKAIGYKMRAEGETAYEPHILIRLEALKPKKSSELAQIAAYVEKDRTGVLGGRIVINPDYASLCKPLLPLLGDKQAAVESTDETARRDAEVLAEQDAKRGEQSAQLLKEQLARMELCKTDSELKALGLTITPQLKAKMTTADVATLRENYLDHETRLKR
jgi:hypothetical protein